MTENRLRNVVLKGIRSGKYSAWKKPGGAARFITVAISTRNRSLAILARNPILLLLVTGRTAKLRQTVREAMLIVILSNVIFN